MMHQVRLAFDSGWTDGDPGDGRLRFDAPSIVKARYAYVNARDAQEALLEDIVPGWGLGDVLVVERIGAREPSRIVAWIIGPIRHGGCYWKVPVSVRTVSGSFAAHDEVRLIRFANEAETASAAPSQPVVPPAPVAPVAAQDVAVPDAGRRPVAAPALTPVAPVAAQQMAALQADNDVLRDLLRELTADTTPLELVTNAQ